MVRSAPALLHRKHWQALQYFGLPIDGLTGAELGAVGAEIRAEHTSPDHSTSVRFPTL